MSQIKEKKSQAVQKFYLLEYFFVLLKSVQINSHEKDIIDSFNVLKQKHLLGESKYRKLSFKKETGKRYLYTFKQVLEESLTYNFVTKSDNNEIQLTKTGQKLIQVFEEKGIQEFYYKLIPVMERHYDAFRYLINFCFEFAKGKGLIIFPIYSPLKLNMDRKDIKTTYDIKHYLNLLSSKLTDDLAEYIGKTQDLSTKNNNLMEQLIASELLNKQESQTFNPKKYNSIIQRIRKFWLNFFLKEIYKYKYSWTTFEVWAYRAKQMGLIHATSFYPRFNGLIIYPTSVILAKTVSKDFTEVYQYENHEKLFLHSPSWHKEEALNEFVDNLIEGYFSLRKTNQSYFMNLADLREIVCYKMKISEYVFGQFLNEAYKMSLRGELKKIGISLEADKLPSETDAMYLKREPVVIDNKSINIIAIDITGKRNDI